MRTTTFVLAVASASFVEAQVPTRTYAKHEVEYAEPFSQIVGLRELSDGRVMVADARDKILQIIDFKGGAPKKIGREGSGPGEWMSLSRLLAYPGDTTLMPDVRNNRLLVIAPDGTPTRTISPAAIAGPGGNVQILGSGGGIVGARFVDSRGRLYYQDGTFSFGGGGAGALPDSAAVLRHDMRTNTTDTMTYVKLAKRGPTTTAAQGTGTVSTTPIVPFAALDVWAALPDGRVVVARPTDYHVEFATSRGTRTAGPRVQYTPVPVTAAEKKALMDSRRATRSQSTMMINGAPVTPPPPAEPSEWPAAMPPFAAGAVFATPSGETWVLRSRSAADSVPTLDVFAGDGRNIARVVLPKGANIAGFGAKSLYLYRTDDDGLQYLQRYALQ